ncbi:MAG: phosphate/phosphite/phosphonate ABC transporter substrate-binding protein [Thermodesulfobacteriota bacterium]|nr:phosphate/phosphite/phosphonate ABC transporter substrate-binding protein [Thermodesulfobacteriota bacterium]
MTIKYFIKRCLALIFFVCLFISISNADSVKEKITIAIFPCTDVVMSFKKFNPLITYLREATHLDINLVVPADFDEFERDIINKNISFALQDPYIYVKLARLYDKNTLLGTLTRDGATSQSSVLIVRKDSDIKELNDLIGKTVMFGPKLSAAKCVAAKLLFEENCIDIDKDIGSYSNGKCCEDIAFSVYLKAVDAGVVCDHFLEEHAKKQKELGVKSEEIQVIGRTRPVPARVFTSCQGINPEIVTRINQALLKLDNNNPNHNRILYNAELGGFLKGSDRDYNAIRILIGQRMVE